MRFDPQRPISQIAQCPYPIIHHAVTEKCAHFCDKMVHCEICCLMHYGICKMGLMPCNTIIHKQRVLMHGHQGWNVRHGLCHFYMIYIYIYIWVVYSFCFLCCLFITVTWWYVWCIEWASGNQEEVQACFGNLMAIYHIMLQFIQNHSRFVMLMIWK